MRILLFLARPGSGGEEVLAELSRTVPAGHLAVVRGWEGFKEALVQRDDPSTIVIIWGPTDEDLRKAEGVRDVLGLGRVLLALPDQTDETIVLAHRLLPAFITYIDDGTAELLSVVGKLTRPGPDRSRPRGPAS